MFPRFASCTLLLFAFSGASAQDAYQLTKLSAKIVTVAQGAYFPRLVQTRSGDLLAFLKTGAAHIGKSGKASVSRSADGGQTWSQAETVFDKPGADDGIVASGVLSDGTVLAAAVSYTWAGERYTYRDWHADMWILRSSDEGMSWSAPQAVSVRPFDWAYPFGRILELSDGSLFMTGYGGSLPMTDDAVNYVFAVRSTDKGKTWSAPVVMAKGYNETSTVVRKDGSLLAVMRASAGGHLAAAVSSDQGKTWSAPRQVTAADEHPGDLLRLRNGDLLLTFGRRHKPYGVQALISRDDGQTWDDAHRFFLAWDGDHRDLGYPETIERPDGRLVTVYYIVYGERDPEGVKGIAPKNAFVRAVIWNRNREERRAMNWSEVAPLQRAISGAGVAAIGGEVFVAGGATWEEGVKRFLADVQVFQPAAGTWRAGPPLPRGAAYGPFTAGSAALEIFGGTDGANSLRSIWKLQAGATSWEVAGETPSDTILGVAARAGGHVFLFGGCADVADLTRCSNGVWRRGGGTAWEQVSTLPVPGLSNAAAASVGGKVYVFGGCNMPAAGDLRNRAEAHAFDPATATWKRLKDLPRPNRGLTAHSSNERTILLLGGYAGAPGEEGGFSSEIWAYDTATDTYRLVGSFPLAAAGTEMVRSGSMLYGIGGEDRMRHRSARVFAASID